MLTLALFKLRNSCMACSPISARFPLRRNGVSGTLKSTQMTLNKAFTLVEMLTVLVLIVIIASFAVPAFNSTGRANQSTKAAYDIAGTLEQARAYAMARNTYVWVGFYEEDASKPTPSTELTTANGNGGRIIISVVASKDGSRYSDASVTAKDPLAFDPLKLVQISKLIKVENMHMGTLNDGLAPGSSQNVPPRPAVATGYQIGDPAFATHMPANGGAPVQNPTTFTYPLSGTKKYTFLRIVEFSPQGMASQIVDNIINGPQKWMEIGLQPTNGNAVAPPFKGTKKASAAIMIEGITGRVEVIR